MQYKKLDVETKCHLRTVKEQAAVNTKIIEEAKQQLLKGSEIAPYVAEIEETAKHSLESIEHLRGKYDTVIYKVKDCCGQAKAGYERNEHKADIAEKVGFHLILSLAGEAHFKGFTFCVHSIS